MKVELIGSDGSVVGTLEPQDGGVRATGVGGRLMESMVVVDDHGDHVTPDQGEAYCRAVAARLQPPYFYGRILE
jgi:hypothetical protein